MPVSVAAEGLSRAFGRNRALDQLTFRVDKGEIFGLLGPNGAGKTTAVRLINGLLSPSSGRVRVFGLDPLLQGSEVRRRSGVLTEAPSLYEGLSARENLRLFGALYGIPKDVLPARVERQLEFFQLAERGGERVGGFSKGMKQRLALARALLHEPELICLDEPTSGLDPEAARQVTDLIERLSREHGRTVLLCTHNLTEAQRLCDRVAVLDRGRLLALGGVEELSRSLWSGVWVDVELLAEPPTGTASNLSAVAGVLEVAIQDLHLGVQVEVEAVVPQVVGALVGSGAQVLRVNPREHSLEEVYFTLRQRRGQS